MTFRQTFALLLVLVFVSQAAQACRYSVRDIGFVNRPEGMPHAVLYQPTPGDDQVEAFFRPRLRELGLSFAVRDAAESDHEPGLWMVRGENDEYLILKEQELSDPSQSAAWRQLEDSAATQSLLHTLVDHACVVLLINACDQASCDAAAKQANEAIRRAVDEAELWAKPMKSSPVLVEVGKKNWSNYELLCWSLGLSEIGAPPSPAVAVIYGRIRRIGPVFRGETLNASAISRTIGVLGRDCECDLGREIFDGPTAPHRWPEKLAKQARERLEFDPQHPMTEVEVRQILAKKPIKEAVDLLTGEDVFWGYEEIDLNAMFDDEEQQTPDAQPLASQISIANLPPDQAPMTTVGIGSKSYLLLGGALLVAVASGFVGVLLVNGGRN